MVTWLSPLPHTCADQQQKPPATQTAGPLLWPLQSAPAQHSASSSQAVRPWGGLSYFIPHATRQLLAHALFSLYFLHFQQFANLKHTHLLNQGHHLEHDQDYEICNLSLSEQNASRWDNTLISSSVSATILSHFSIFFFSSSWELVQVESSYLAGAFSQEQPPCSCVVLHTVCQKRSQLSTLQAV